MYWGYKTLIMKKFKKVIVLIFATVLVSSCTQSIDGNLESDYIETRQYITYYKGAVYSGEIFFIYENGQLESRINYKDGKLDGLAERYWKDGSLDYKQNYKDGQQDGLKEWTAPGFGGRILIKSYYKDNRLNGVEETYYEGGQLMQTVNYKDGQEDGLMKGYYEGGQIRVENTYKDGVLISNKYYSEDGQIQ